MRKTKEQIDHTAKRQLSEIPGEFKQYQCRIFLKDIVLYIICRMKKNADDLACVLKTANHF
jgi:hypothetical protein